MLKCVAGGEKDGKRVRIIVLGLSYTNLERLKEGKPIDIDAEELGMIEGTRIMIFAGETEQKMARALADLIGPETRVTIDPRLQK